MNLPFPYLCPRCSAAMMMCFGGGDNHLNWWECKACGYNPVMEQSYTTTTTPIKSKPDIFEATYERVDAE